MESIKKRILPVNNMTCSGCEETIKSELSSLPGVNYVEANHKSGKLFVSYDLLKINLKSIEKRMEELGYAVKKSFLHNLKNGFIDFFEENERDNLTTRASACCSNPREILDKAGGK